MSRFIWNILNTLKEVIKDHLQSMKIDKHNLILWPKAKGFQYVAKGKLILLELSWPMSDISAKAAATFCNRCQGFFKPLKASATIGGNREWLLKKAYTHIINVSCLQSTSKNTMSNDLRLSRCSSGQSCGQDKIRHSLFCSFWIMWWAVNWIGIEKHFSVTEALFCAYSCERPSKTFSL